VRIRSGHASRFRPFLGGQGNRKDFRIAAGTFAYAAKEDA
jgi:hypothetical protein